MSVEKPVFSYQQMMSVESFLLAPGIGEKETIDACTTAITHHIAAVCVKPCYVHQAVSTLREANTKPATVIGYPFGDQPTTVKVSGAKRAMTEGVLELNLVANTAYLLDGRVDLFEEDINSICCLARMNYALVNTILNCKYLTDDLIIKGAEIIGKTGSEWISPSSGLENAKNDESYFPLLKNAVGKSVKLKSMGKINNRQTFVRLRELGCDRIAIHDLNLLLNSFDEIGNKEE